MNNIKEFNAHPISRRDFWLATFPVLVGILLLTAIIILWKRQYVIKLRSDLKTSSIEKWSSIKKKWSGVGNKWSRFRRGATSDVEKGSHACNSQELMLNSSANLPGSPHTLGDDHAATAGGASTTPPSSSPDPNLPSESVSTNLGPLSP